MQVLRPLLEPLATPLTVTLHPVKQLEIMCVEKGWSLQIRVNHSEKFVQAEVWVNELVMGNSQNEDKKVARRLAAAMVLSAFQFGSRRRVCPLLRIMMIPNRTGMYHVL